MHPVIMLSAETVKDYDPMSMPPQVLDCLGDARPEQIQLEKANSCQCTGTKQPRSCDPCKQADNI